MSFKYKPKNTYWTPRDIENFMSDFGKDIKKFFSFPEIEKLVEENEWGEIFEKWGDHDYNPSDWIGEILAFFLYNFAKVDFMEYLNDPNYYGIVCFEDD